MRPMLQTITAIDKRARGPLFFGLDKIMIVRQAAPALVHGHA